MKTKTIAERLTALREEYKLSSEKFARLVNMSRVTIDNVEKGKSIPYRSNIETIAKKFGSTYEWLSEGKGQMLPNGRVDIMQDEPTKDGWKDEAWELAKAQINKKDETIDRLSIAFDRLTEILSRSNVNFLEPVKDTAVA